MAECTHAPALSFRETTFDVVDRGSRELWLRLGQIAPALGYSDPRNLNALYASNAAEFTPSMTALVKLPTAGGVQEVRIFSLRGAHLLGMFARTERAAEFRRWVLDVLEREAAGPAPSAPALPPPTFERVLAERDTLRAMLAEMVLKDEPVLRQVLYYYSIDGLSHRERALLCGWKTTDAYLAALRRLATLGLVEYEPNAKLSANGKKNIAKLHQRLAAGPLPAPNPFPPGHPLRKRPNAGKTPQQMAELRALRTARATKAKAALAKAAREPGHE